MSPSAFLEIELMLLLEAKLLLTPLVLEAFKFLEIFDEFEFLLMALGLFSLFEFLRLFKLIVDWIILGSLFWTPSNAFRDLGWDNVVFFLARLVFEVFWSTFCLGLFMFLEAYLFISFCKVLKFRNLIKILNNWKCGIKLSLIKNNNSLN